MPAPDRRGLGTAKEHPSYAHRAEPPRRRSPLPSRPITAPIPQAPLPRQPPGCWRSCSPAEDVCQLSLEALLAAEGFAANPARMLQRPGRGRRSLSKAERARRGVPTRYRLHAAAR